MPSQGMSERRDKSQQAIPYRPALPLKPHQTLILNLSLPLRLLLRQNPIIACTLSHGY